MHQLPEPLKAVVDQLTRLPGLGPKSALRCAMTFLKWPESETRRLGKSIYDLRDALHLCGICGALTEADPCHICRDQRRDQESLCIVADWDSLLTIESGGFYNGQYLILGGLLAPLEDVNPDTLAFGRIDERLESGVIKEIIFALGATVEAESTASFIKNRVCRRFSQMKFTRLAQGIPLGSEVKFMDKETLQQSLRYRQDV